MPAVVSENQKSNHKSVWVSICPIIHQKNKRREKARALCTTVPVSFHLALLSLPFNPVISAPWAGEVSQRLSHGLRANPTPQALPEGRPSVRSVWSVLGGKASAAWPNSTFQHTPPSPRKAPSIHSRQHAHTQPVPKHKQINKQTVNVTPHIFC